jgi:hypothetical protein
MKKLKNFMRMLVSHQMKLLLKCGKKSSTICRDSFKTYREPQNTAEKCEKHFYAI